MRSVCRLSQSTQIGVMVIQNEIMIKPNQDNS